MKLDIDLERIALSPQRMREIGYRAIDMLVDHHVNLADKPVTNQAGRASLDAKLSEAPPRLPSDPGALLEQLESDVFAHMMFSNHPRFFGFIPGPSNYVGVIGDLLASGYGTITSTWMESAGPTALELITVDWLRELLGFPNDAGGLFVSGGSVANLTGLAAARHVALDDRTEDAVVYMTSQAHGSLGKALRLLSLDRHVHQVPVDDGQRMDSHALEAAIAQDRAAGRRPFCVVATAGTTNTGAVDPLPDLLRICRAQELWLHVDGAFGAAAALSVRGNALLPGLGEVDSIAIDPHKWLFQPFEIGCTLVRNARWLPQTFSGDHAYMQDFDLNPTDPEVNLCDHGIQLTRVCRAIKCWLTFKTFGVDAIAAAIDKAMDLAELAERRFESDSRFAVVTPARLAIVSFRYHRANASDAVLDQVNAAIVEACVEEGYALVTSTQLDGRTVLRLCTINPRTEESDIDGTIERLGRYGDDALERIESIDS